MTEKTQHRPLPATRTVNALHELVAALDRRVPHADRPDERRIAQDARVLRRLAVERIAALNRQGPQYAPYDQGLVHPIMTDDGCPWPERTAARAAIGDARQAHR